MRRGCTSGQVDAIILTGGLAYGKNFVKEISDRINWIADVFVHPGENELHALAEGAYEYYAAKKR